MATGIYVIENVANGRRYVGSAVNIEKRWKEHRRQLSQGRHHSKFLQNAWDKHGEAAFRFRVVLFCDRPNLLWYEQALIDAWQPDYNSAPTAGSQLGFRHRSESKARMSEAAKRTRNFTGHRHTEETKRRISEAKQGRTYGPQTAERRAKIGAAHKGKVITAEQRARISAALTGRKQSPETIAKRVVKLRGRKMPPGFAEATAARMRGRKLPPETIAKIARSRSVLNEDQVRLVRNLLGSGDSHRAIGMAVGVSHSTIADISCGRKYRWVA